MRSNSVKTHGSVSTLTPHHKTHHAKQSLSLSVCTLLISIPNPRGFAMKGGKSKTETKKADNKLSVKKRGAATEKPKPVKKGKAAKDPNKPKRPASAFFVFMEEFRKQYKEKHPNNKSVSVVGKAGGDKWKSLSEALRQRRGRHEYNKTLLAYNKKLAEGANAAEEEESDKSRSEVNDDDEDESGEEDDEDDE
ncbi:hypothetical protein F0562_006788 [Nyssa sinensis]|uniref:HMG box domain-containing protein n=1 Tax=Nyssa sinensis TaxID=561372 RepID=A0A5J5AN40_9ASTE|nr:hypothetical protein F0562_006788 [Nyssa sinensis]